MENKPIHPKFQSQFTGKYSSGEAHLAWVSKQYYKKDVMEQAQENTESLQPKKPSIMDEYGPIGQSIVKAKHTDLNIWQKMDSINWKGDIVPQKVIESMMGLKSGETILAFDFETLGSYHKDPSRKKPNQLGWYTPTEIAFASYKVGKDGTLERTGTVAGKDYLSILVKPDEVAQARIKALLNKVKSQKYAWSGLTADERRTLNDLIL